MVGSAFTTSELIGTARAGTVTTVLGMLPARTPVPDGPATVVLRPEQLKLGGNGTAALLGVRHFYGADTVVGVQLPDGTSARVRVPGRFTPDGDTVTVAVVGDVLAYPTGTSPAGGQRMAFGEPGG